MGLNICLSFILFFLGLSQTLLDIVEMLFHELLILWFLLSDFRFEVIQCLLQDLVLDWVAVLYDTGVAVRDYVTTVCYPFELGWLGRYYWVLLQSTCPRILGVTHLVMLGGGCFRRGLFFCKQVILQIGPQLHGQPLPVLVDYVSRSEREVVVPFRCFDVLLVPFAKLVVQLFLVVEEQEFVFQNVRTSHLKSLLPV